ncbi:MAG: sodium-dependent transporter [Victivallaceae bacterium]
MSKNKEKREHWSGSLGFVLAAAGSAVGLGNIWKFPYITGQNGGGAFVLIYLACILVIGLPVMLCEITLGRKTQKNPVGAFKQLTPKKSMAAHLLGLGLIIVGVGLICFKHWGFGTLCVLLGGTVFAFSWTVVGAMGVLAGFVILAFYSVVAGWTIGYTLKSATGDIKTAPEVQSSALLANIILNDVKTVPPDKQAEIDKKAQLHLISPAQQAAELKQSAQTSAVNYAAKTFKVIIPISEAQLNKREFQTVFTETLSSQAGQDKLLQDLVQRRGGMQKNADGQTNYPKSLLTSIAGQQFALFMDNPFYAISFHLLFMLMCVGIVCLGVKDGIEKSSKILMPLLFLLLLALIIRGITLKGAMDGVRFFLSPDFSKLNQESVLVALGHAFFSLSLGMGAMITYGSYVKKDQNLFLSTLSVTALDTLVALMAGLAIFPAVFAEGFSPASGPGLVFQTLPAVFNNMPLGMFWATLFFLLLLVAALTSGVSLLEVVTAYFVDERKWNRKVAACVIGFIIFLLGALCAISIGDWDRIEWLQQTFITLFGTAGSSFFDVLDNLGSNWLLPWGGMLTSLFVGWIWGTRKAVEEIRHGSSNFADVHLISLLSGLKDDPSHNNEKYHVITLAALWGILIRFIAPAAVMLAFLHTVGWISLT